MSKNMTEQANTYQLATIHDVFNKVPLDRIEDCMKELTTLLMQSKATELTILEAAKNSGMDLTGTMLFQLPETLNWIDDNKGEVTMGISLNGEILGEIKTSLNTDETNPQPEKFFYAIGDSEILCATTEHDAVIEWFDGLSADDVKDLPATVSIGKYTPRKVDENLNLFDCALDSILENLEEEYGSGEEPIDYSLSDKAKALYQAFVKQVCREFPSCQCELVDTIEVNPMDFLDADDLVVDGVEA